MHADILLQTYKIIVCALISMCRVCYSSVSSYTHSAYAAQELYYYNQAYTYYTSCGLFGWGRCSRTGYTQR